MRRWTGASFTCPLCGKHATDDPRYFCCAGCRQEVISAMAEEWVRNRLAAGQALTRDGLLAERLAAREGTALADRQPCPTPPRQERSKNKIGPPEEQVQAVHDFFWGHQAEDVTQNQVLRGLKKAGHGMRRTVLLRILADWQATPPAPRSHHGTRKGRQVIYWRF